MGFEFATATRILFGRGVIREVPAAAASFGSRVLLATGENAERAAGLRSALEKQGLAVEAFPVSGEPTVESVSLGLQVAREAGADVIVALGGGSAIDSGKAVAALLSNGGEPLDYMEVIGRGKAIAKPSLPFIAIPTTAGAGSEVTRNAVLGSPSHHVKVSLRSPLMLPRFAVVDPELTFSLPPSVTASTGLDALTQLIEPYTSNNANPLTDALCVDGIRRVGRSLRRAYSDGRDAEAREDMSLASLYGGLALSNARLGAVHGFAGTLGGVLGAPHGAICARLLPFVIPANIRALQARAPDSPVLQRYDEVGRLLTGRADATARDGVEWLKALCSDLSIPPLSGYGLTEEDFGPIVGQARAASSMKGNPIPLTEEEMTGILKGAM